MPGREVLRESTMFRERFLAEWGTMALVAVGLVLALMI